MPFGHQRLREGKYTPRSDRSAMDRWDKTIFLKWLDTQNLRWPEKNWWIHEGIVPRTQRPQPQPNLNYKIKNHTPAQKKFLKKLGLVVTRDTIEEATSNNNIEKEDPRRSFKKRPVKLLCMSLYAFSHRRPVAQSTQKIRRYSAPSDLKITDMRYVLLRCWKRTAIIRTDTQPGNSRPVVPKSI